MSARDEPADVALQRAEPHDAGTLANLLELYIHDLSELFSVPIGDNGRFGYERLASYWQRPQERFAFLIKGGRELAGFALATRGSPMSDDPQVLDVAEFFVLRRQRRAGVGRVAAFLLWDLMPGSWVVRVAETNRGALEFWRTAVATYSGGAGSERRVSRPERVWHVFEFDSRR